MYDLSYCNRHSCSVTMCEARASKFRKPKWVEEEEVVILILVHKAVLSKYKMNKWATSIFYEWQTGRTVEVPVLDSGGLLTFLLFNEFRYCRECRCSGAIE